MLQVCSQKRKRSRELRRRLEDLFGLCGSPASASKNFLAFAGTPQAPRKTFWPLREPRKHLEKLFALCGSPASASKNFSPFAGAPQAPRKTFWPLREPRKHFRKTFRPLQGRCKHFRKTKDRDMTSRPPTRRMRGGVTRHEGKNVRSDGGVSGLN